MESKAKQRGRLIIVCGLPGAGKTTLAKRLEHSLGGVRFAPDEWMDALEIDLYDQDSRARIESLQWKLAQQILELGQVAIIEWGTWSKTERDQLRQGARELGAAVELRYLSAPVEELFKRIRRRGMEDPPIQRQEILGWSELIEAPTEEELALYDPPAPSP